MPADPIRILLVDDQPLFRDAIATLVDGQEDMTVVGVAENGLAGLDAAHRLEPDLVVMDVEMPVMNGVEAARLIREQLPAVKVVMLTVDDDDDHLFAAIKNGAHGYLLKDLRPEQLYDLLRSVMRGESALSPRIASRLLLDIREGLIRRPDAARSHESMVTPRELEILQLVAEGMSNKEIGRALHITEGTVKNHVHNALERLHMENRIQAAAYIVRHGLGRPPQRG
jgi:DNA-binding NarL/FixJ family response regulator